MADHPVIRSLKPDEWPLSDQAAWADACRAGGRLTGGGRASHLKPVTRGDLAQRYGQFLGFLSRSGGLDLNARTAGLVEPVAVSAYMAELASRLSSVTVHGSIARLRRMAGLLDPGFDGAWLRDIEQDLAWHMRPAPKFDRIVDTDRIVEAGLILMQEAATHPDMPPARRRADFRNGLMIALLALRKPCHGLRTTHRRPGARRLNTCRCPSTRL